MEQIITPISDEVWSVVLGEAGVPLRYKTASLNTNCAKYESANGKSAAYQTAVQMSEDGCVSQRGQERYSLFITGGFGVGKTWLATGLFKRMLWKLITNQEQRMRQAKWLKAYQLVRNIQVGYSDGTADERIKEYQRYKILMIDDLGDLDRPESDDKAQLIYEIIDYRNDYLLPTIITSNLMPNQVSERFGQRMFERIAELSAMVKMQGANLRRESL